MHFETSTPRRHRSFLLLKARLSMEKLYLLSPKITGLPQWRYGVMDGNKFVIVGKPVSSRDEGRQASIVRYGVRAKELRLPKAKKAA